MKRNNVFLSTFVAVLMQVLCISGISALQELPFPNPKQLISMDFKNAQLKDVLKIFSVQSGLNFIASEAVRDRSMTLYFDKVPVEQAMQKLFEANNLSYDLDDEAKVFIVKDWGKPDVELETRVFNLKYSSVSSSHIMEEVQNNIGKIGESSSGGAAGEQGGRYAVSGDIGITTAVRRLLSQYGTVIEDYRTNSLIVQDIPARMPNIEKAIATLDVPTPQVVIEVEMLDVNKNLVDKIGFKYGQTPVTLNLSGIKLPVTYPFFPSALSSFENLRNSWNTGAGSSPLKTMLPGTADFSTAYSIALDFLRTQTDTRFLARPRILTLNNETAEFKITTEETINVVNSQTSTSSGSTTTVSNEAERAETGITLRVTPQINPQTGEITMFIMPTVRDTSASGYTNSAGQSIKDPEERTTKSIIRVKDGETLIMGGLIRKQKSVTNTKLPGLSEIPLLGGLFRHKSKDKDQERELLIFITPRIVKEKGANTQKVAPAAATKVPSREQASLPMADRKAAISSSLNKFER